MSQTPVPTAETAIVPDPAPATSPARTTEGSLLGRFVALLSPVFAIAAGWLAGVVAHVVPGADLDQTQIVAFMLAASTSALSASWKWLQGWQLHQQLVADGKVLPRRPAPPATPAE